MTVCRKVCDMYMNIRSFELLDHPERGYVKVDDLIAPAIRLLNLKNYITSACCSGHSRLVPEYAYIQYDFGEMTPERLPDGWFWDGDGQMYFEYLSQPGPEREQEIRKTMNALYEWAQDLPDAH